jgi:hypothetical protein
VANNVLFGLLNNASGFSLETKEYPLQVSRT